MKLQVALICSLVPTCRRVGRNQYLSYKPLTAKFPQVLCEPTKLFKYSVFNLPIIYKRIVNNNLIWVNRYYLFYPLVYYVPPCNTIGQFCNEYVELSQR